VVLAGALGIHPYVDAGQPRDQSPDRDDAREATAPAWPGHAWHAPLLIAGLLPYAPAILDAYLAADFAEYAREAREEQPCPKALPISELLPVASVPPRSLSTVG
jgi:hypothetical protein